MRRHTSLMAVTAVLAATGSLLLAGCGGDDDSDAADGTTSTPAATTAPAETTGSTATSPAATAPATATTVAVVLGKPQEFSLTAEPASIPAGKATFNVVNNGTTLHEMVIVPAPDGAAALREDNGEATEEGALGEVADLEPGADGTVTVTMPAGDYVLLCNLPGHFAGGMYTDLTVD